MITCGIIAKEPAGHIPRHLILRFGLLLSHSLYTELWSSPFTVCSNSWILPVTRYLSFTFPVTRCLFLTFPVTRCLSFTFPVTSCLSLTFFSVTHYLSLTLSRDTSRNKFVSFRGISVKLLLFDSPVLNTSRSRPRRPCVLPAQWAHSPAPKQTLWPTNGESAWEPRARGRQSSPEGWTCTANQQAASEHVRSTA